MLGASELQFSSRIQYTKNIDPDQNGIQESLGIKSVFVSHPITLRILAQHLMSKFDFDAAVFLLLIRIEITRLFVLTAPDLLDPSRN